MTPEKKRAIYELRKDKARRRIIEIGLAGRDIGEIPAVVDSARREKSSRDFCFFCREYFPQIFSLPFSRDHLRVIAKIERAILHGGLFAVAMPRGSGKTTLAEIACIWAILHAHRHFVVLVGASEAHAEQMLECVRTELETNDQLLADFPETIFPIRALEGIANRCAGQLCNGERTNISWTGKELIFPTVRGSKTSGAIFRVAGITGRIRGMKHRRATGESIRPDLVVIDDPQTDDSARSFSQCAMRERILAGAILGLAGPGKKISGIMPCTVIRRGDVADNILDPAKHPEWNGERMRMIYAFPKNEGLWKKYAEIRAESLRAHGDLREATAFYLANQQAMDEGAEVAWPERFNHDEASAIQHAMNLFLQDECAFWAEYQNLPPADKAWSGAETIEESALRARANGMARGAVPLRANYLTAFIDVQSQILYYVVAAWETCATCHIVDYGTFPDQPHYDFSARNPPRSLQQEFSAGLEGSIYNGLKKCVEKINREYIREDGAILRIGRILIDANWGQATEIVYQFCRQSQHASLIFPSHGRYIGARGKPMSEYRKNPGDVVGNNWRLSAASGKHACRYILFDANAWKSFMAQRIATATGDPGSWSIFGEAKEHRYFFRQLVSEYRVRTEGRGRVVDEWQMRPDFADNHWWDCIVGAAVAADTLGAGLQLLPNTNADAVSIKTPQLARKRRRGYFQSLEI